MSKQLRSAALAILIAAVPAAAWGQATQPDSRPAVQREGGPASQEKGATTEPLSDRLSRTDGVIRPKAGVDLEMNKGAPATKSDMPVIAPPGSPGGDPTIRPQ